MAILLNAATALSTMNMCFCFVVSNRFQSRDFVNNIPSIRSVYRLSWDDCLRECQVRGSCQSVTYRRQFQECRLFDLSALNASIEASPGVVYGEPSWRTAQIISGTCSVLPCPAGFVCTSNGTCLATECENPNPIPSSWLQGNMWQVGSHIKYTCITELFGLEESEVSICQTNGGWSNISLVCECGSPIIVDNAVTVGNSALLGTNVTYTCTVGYHGNGGTFVSICLGTAGWSTPTLACILNDCGTFPVIENAFAIGLDTHVGSNVTYLCYTGHVWISGVNIATCAETGSWSVINMTCTAIECGQPMAIDNAIVAGNSTRYGDSITYVCKPGYKSNDTQTDVAVSMCDYNGYWTAVNFTCVLDMSDMVDFSLYMTGAFLSQTAIVKQTYGEAVFTGLSLPDCAQKCREEKDYCIAISYCSNNLTCVLVDRLIDIFMTPGWNIYGKYIGVEFKNGPNGWYTLTFNDAVDFCSTRGSSVATLQDIQTAFDLGYNMNQCGWIANNKAVIILHYPDPGFFTQTGITYCTWGSTWGVYCTR